MDRNPLRFPKFRASVSHYSNHARAWGFDNLSKLIISPRIMTLEDVPCILWLVMHARTCTALYHVCWRELFAVCVFVSLPVYTKTSASHVSVSPQHPQREVQCLLIHNRLPHHQTASCKKSSLFDQIKHDYHPMTFRSAHETNSSNINKCHQKITKIHIKQKSAFQYIEKHKFCQPACLYTSQADRMWIIAKMVPHSRA